ncbi:hypothetical protein PT169_03650 [Erysipelothrix rhusiopathiae]|nr:hypothetical protein [Erysipelothrix rhusiopathiae]
MIDYFEISYLDALEKLGEELLSVYINDFECRYIKGDAENDVDTEINDVEKFIKEKIKIYDKNGISRSYLIFAKANSKHTHKLILVGYYSIAFKPFEFSSDVSRASKKRIAGHHTFMKGPLPAILIGQLGKMNLIQLLKDR